MLAKGRAMKLGKAQVQARVHAIPVSRLVDLRLSSLAGVILLQALFKRVGLKARLARCWQPGYWTESVSPAVVNPLLRYIADQRRHHAGKGHAEPWETEDWAYRSL